MTDAKPTAAARWRTWWIVAGFAVLVIAGFYGVARLGFRIWVSNALPADAPNIAFSVDDSILAQVGITRATYEQAMTRAGARLVPVERETFGADELKAGTIRDWLVENNIRGVLLSGGDDVDPALYGGDSDKAIEVNRSRDDFEIALIRESVALGLPVLGVCRGCQVLNVAFGGTLRNLRDDKELKEAHFTFSGHDVTLEADSRLAEALGVDRLENVYSFHGQAVGELGDGVRAVAHGPGVVEAIEVEREWIVGVQWHPEMEMGNEVQDRLFRGFVDAAELVDLVD